MGRWIAGTFIAALLCSGSAWGQPGDSAEAVMPGCRNFIQSDGTARDAQDAFDRGFCSGVLKAIVEADPKICPPRGATRGHTMRLVTQYIDGLPARLHESFVSLATEALRTAWPCKR